ncbi:hypothetical protein HSB1_29840 [Halogranum salarium B-1]|uniref:Uncharacterized protein n=1 Tax=Halogranum salarium B-1 TaxID=1210908 RepID=J3JEM8_9EURY|nr:hypothetical protein HSB1_29840 [Halogranum salarium B-1]
MTLSDTLRDGRFVATLVGLPWQKIPRRRVRADRVYLDAGWSLVVR